MDHLSEQELNDFWSCRLEPSAVRRLVHHLMTSCERCRQLLIATIPPKTSFWERERPAEDAYDAAINRAQRKVRKVLPRLVRDRERRDLGLKLLQEKGGWTQLTWPEHRSFQGIVPQSRSSFSRASTTATLTLGRCCNSRRMRRRWLTGARRLSMARLCFSIFGLGRGRSLAMHAE